MKIVQRLITLFLGLLLFLSATEVCLADDATIEVVPGGKVNIRSVINLAPTSSAPTDPQDGDMYLTGSRELMLYGNEKWNKVMFYPQDWEIGEWSECSAPCGGGTQTRSVICRRADGQQVPDSYCSDKPVTSQSCNTQGCLECPAYVKFGTCWAYFPTPQEVGIYWGGAFVGSVASQSGSESIDLGGYRYTRKILQETDSLIANKYFSVCREPL